MSTDRRAFLKASAVVGGAVLGGFSPAGAAAGAKAAPEPAPARSRKHGRARAPLRILILGGTGFTGPEQVEYALARGHSVTLINRNKTRPDLFKGKVDALVGDLSGDMSALKGRTFDVVIDNPTTFPAWVRNAAQYLKGNTKHYIFISTISVYPDNSVPGADETAPTTPMPAALDPYTLVPTDAQQNYGALKSFSEKEVEKHYPGINTIVRPGLIVGPLDPSDRFTYWPARIDKGGMVACPGKPTDPAQFIDARDLAEWMIRMAEGREFGTYNATGPAAQLTFGEMLYGIKSVTTAGAQFTWLPAEFLAEQKVRGWSNLPVWLNPAGGTAGFLKRNTSRALAKGLTFRPLAVTAKDTLEWHQTRTVEEKKRLDDGTRVGLSAAREADLLKAWADRPGKPAP